MKQMQHVGFVFVLLCSAIARGQTNATSNATAPAKLDESAFRIVEERNIFNANRSGGQVRATNTRRPTRVDAFTLVGTMAYEKGAFAFFDGSSSELSKVLKPGGIIAGYKIVDILPGGVKLELDGKEIELPVGSQMRREDEGAWHVAEATSRSNGSSSYAASRETDSASRSSRSSRSSSSSRGRDESGGPSRSEPPAAAATSAAVDERAKEEALKRMMERREKD